MGFIRKYDKLQGGFIWDFQDWIIGKRLNGREYFAYGGDGLKGHPDHNLNNGLISADKFKSTYARS